MATGATPAKGTIVGTTRTEDGAERDTFVPSSKVDPANMAGRALMCDLGGLLVQSFVIEKIEEAAIVTPDDPGMTIKGNLIKLQHFPSWGIRGECRFTIDRPVLVRRATERRPE
jgi:hypothetical protein